MMRGLLNRIIRRPRKYPVKRDAWGGSARRRAFELFDRGMRPSKVAPLVGIPPWTAYRYFQSWKRRPMCLELRYRLLKAALRSRSVATDQFAGALAEAVDMRPQQMLDELKRPWGLKRLLSGKLKAMEKEASLRRTIMRLAAALEIVRMEEARGVEPDIILKALARLEQQNRPNDHPPAGRGFVVQ